MANKTKYTSKVKAKQTSNLGLDWPRKENDRLCGRFLEQKN
ncbi:hypothetical protein [Turicimonas sp. TL08]